jgi:hypothetical protein
MRQQFAVDIARASGRPNYSSIIYQFLFHFYTLSRQTLYPSSVDSPKINYGSASSRLLLYQLNNFLFCKILKQGHRA